nr:hypothetical protein [Tanacetum cinerariifolium]
CVTTKARRSGCFFTTPLTTHHGESHSSPINSRATWFGEDEPLTFGQDDVEEGEEISSRKKSFIKRVIAPEFLRKPNVTDIEKHYWHHEEKHGFSGMLESLACTDWEWFGFPYGFKGQYVRRDHATAHPYHLCTKTHQCSLSKPSGPAGGMLVFVSGTMQLAGEEHLLKFSQECAYGLKGCVRFYEDDVAMSCGDELTWRNRVRMMWLAVSLCEVLSYGCDTRVMGSSGIQCASRNEMELACVMFGLVV